MKNIKLSFPPVRTLLDDPELNKFRGVLADASLRVAIDGYLDALDRGDVVLAVILATVFSVPGIVPACITLRGNPDFQAAVRRSENLKRFIGAVTKMRARSVGLVNTGRKGRVGQWVEGFTVAEIYQATPGLWSALAFSPALPNGASIFEVLAPDKEVR